MKKMFRFMVVLLNVSVAVSYSKPMESIDRYNVVLVHGAGGHKYGMDCKNGDSDGKDYKEANEADRNDGYLSLTGGYGENLGLSSEFPFITKNRESSAEDMDIDGNGLRHWLTEYILEDSKEKKAVYLQRPFTNPANSPINNAKELGDPKWKGDSKCSERRSKIEEAQEVKANGRVNLKNYRTNPKYHYKDNLLPPSRNILIAHSMGGVASREYVQGNGYNNDVDKVITLDSPHEGTGALNMLIEMNRPDIFIGESFTNGVALTGIALGIMAISNEPVSLSLALYSLMPAASNMFNNTI